MRDVGGRDLQDGSAQPRPADVEDVAVSEGARRSVQHVVEGEHHPCRTVSDLRVGCRGEELVDGPALVGLDVGEGDPAEPVNGQHLRDRVADEWEELTHTGVVKQRFLGVDQELVESKAPRCDLRDAGGDAVDPIRDLVDLGVTHDFLFWVGVCRTGSGTSRRGRAWSR